MAYFTAYGIILILGVLAWNGECLIPPPPGVTDVKVGFYISEIKMLDDSEAMYVRMYFRQQWNDSRVTNDYPIPSGANSIRIDAWDDVWIPDLFFPGAREVQKVDLPSEQKLMMIKQPGYIWFVQSLSMTLVCPDKRSGILSRTLMCPIRVESYGHTKDTLVMNWYERPVEFGPEAQISSSYTLMDTILYDCSETYPSGSYPCLETKLVLREGFFS